MLERGRDVPAAASADAPSAPVPVLTTVLEADLPGERAGGGWSPRSGVSAAAPSSAPAPDASAPASTVPPAPFAARPRSRSNFPALRAGIHTGKPRCTTARSAGRRSTWPPRSGPGGRPSRGGGQASTVQDLVAGSGIFFADNQGTAGELRLFSVLR